MGQRALWKRWEKAKNELDGKEPDTPRTPDLLAEADIFTCPWSGYDVGECRPTYKHGQQYLMSPLFMLAYPYGDMVRVMSSFAFHEWRHGPPGVRNGTLQDRPHTVFEAR